jgi:hypothetical protein
VVPGVIAHGLTLWLACKGAAVAGGTPAGRLQPALAFLRWLINLVHSFALTGRAVSPHLSEGGKVRPPADPGIRFVHQSMVWTSIP